MKSVADAHQVVLATAKEMLRRGLVEGTSGNISARMADGNIVCTPSSVDYHVMTLEDLVVVGPDGDVVAKAADRSPTSELLLHLACYQAFGANAVTALQDRGAALLPNHGMVAVGPSPAKVLHIVALVERTAQIAWGARALGGIVPIPAKVNDDFAGVYQLMRSL